MFQRLPKKIIISSMLAMSAILMGLVAVHATPPLYDTNINNKIDREEIRAAVHDFYLEDSITSDDMREIVYLYFSDSEIVASDSTVVAGFFCTGSMNPTITCFDTATFATSFAPKDIRVGTIVSGYLCYDPDPNEPKTAHRVTELRGEGEFIEVRTKGDVAGEDDGCWVPYSSIGEILIELHKDTNKTPENIEMRRIVQEAKAALEEAERKQEAAYERYKVEYERLCMVPVDSGAACTLPQGDIDELNELWRLYQEAFDEYEAAFEAYEAALDQAVNQSDLSGMARTLG